MKNFMLALAMGVIVSSCATPTQFEGEAKVVNGPKQCMATCNSWNMILGGMVSMGDYTNGCICVVKGASAVTVNDIGSTLISSGATAGATAGVVTQMRATEERNKQNSNQVQANFQ